jgi:PAS domain S-box-containing protein
MFLVALLALCLPGISLADTALEAWRKEVASVRTLAENDAALAYQNAQSLEANFPADAKPSDKAKILNVLARTELYTTQTSAAAIHAQQALNLAKQYSDREGQAEAYLNISLNAVNQGKVDVIIDMSPRALEVLQGVDNPALLGEAMLRLAMMYLRIGQLEATVTLCMQAMDMAKQNNDPLALLYAHQGLGITFNNSGRYTEAHEHFTQMRDLARAIKLRQPEGEAISGMAFTQAKMGDWRTAVLMHREAIAIFRSVGVPFNTAHALYSLAETFHQHGLLADSLQMLSEAVTIYERYPNKIGIWWALNARSENFQALGRLAAARTDAERAYAQAQNMGLLLYRAESAKRMAAIAAAANDHKHAYQFSAEAADLTDKIAREKTSNRMVELAQRYQSESKQRKIDELTRNEKQHELEQRWLWTILGGSIILLAGTGYFLLRLRRSHRMLQASNAQLRQSQDEIRALNIGLEQRVQASTAELRQQTRYLRTLFDTLPISVWLKDTAGRYLTINTSHVAVKGLTAEQMLGKTDEELWPGEIGAAFRAADIEVMETRHRKTQELAIPGENGAIFWREIDKAPVIDDDGTVIGTVGVGRDISERKRYEQSLLAQAKLEQRLSALTANIPGFVYTIRVEADGHASFPFASGGVEEIFGLRPEEIRNDANVLRARYHPDDLPRMFSIMDESLRTQKPFHAEIRIRNCKRNNEERWVEVRSIPQCLPDGSTEWHGIMLDITERKRIEEALAEREREFRALADSSPGMMGSIYLRPDGSVCMPYVSPNIYELFGLRPQEVAQDASSLLNLNHPEDAQRVRESIAESARTMTTWHQEYRILHPSKGLRWMESNTNPQPHSDGGMLWYGYVFDITERKRAEEVLRFIAQGEWLNSGEIFLNALVRYLGQLLNVDYVIIDKIATDPAYAETVALYAKGEVVHNMRYPLQGTPCANVMSGGLCSYQENVQGQFPEDSLLVEMQAVSYAGLPLWDTNGKVIGLIAVLDGKPMADKNPVESILQLVATSAAAELKRSQMEQVLRESHESLREAQRISHVGNWELDLVGGRLQWSDEIYRIFEITPEQFGASYGDWLNFIHPEDRQRADRAYTDSVKNHTPYELEHRLLLADGKIKHVLERCETLYDEDGKALRSIGTVQDITERKQLEAELRASRNFLDSVIDSVSDPIFVKDRQHRWTLLNDAFCNFIGKPREALIGKSDYDFFPDEEADVFWAKDELVFESKESNLNEERFTSADGEEHHIQTRKTPFVAGDGREMLVGIIRDISDLKRYEAAREAALAEAMRLAKSRSEFLAHMSHELRTPLNGILGYTQILQRNKGLGERNADALNVIRQSGEHLLALVEDILDLARIEAGRFKLDLSDIALTTFLRVVTDIIRVRAKEKNIGFVCDFSRDLPEGIRGDDKRLRQVLLNLLSNAVKFTERGKVTLHVRRTGSSRLAFEVEDTGMGIPAGELETIFQPFEQSGDTQQRFGGSGLGLSISRKLVRLMGGDILVVSKQGEGSTFRFELELPEVKIAPIALLAESVEGNQTATSSGATTAEPLILPPVEELQTLHHLAQLGNMRDIIQYADRIAASDSRYQAFSEHLRRMAEGYQSKAILAFVEEHLNDTQK